MAESNLNGRVLNALIDFNLIVNTDVGLIRFIRAQYQDPRAFDLEKVNKSDREILSLLYSRANPNPLSIISTEENMKDIDELYKSFMESYRDEIYKKSVADASIIRFVQMMISSGPSLGVSCAICVKDDFQKDQIISHFGRGNFIYTNDIKAIEAKDVYYVKDYRFFTDLKLESKIKHTKIYISPSTYNENYFQNTENYLTRSNEMILIGKDYRIKGEDNNERK